jgi:hypothetical protein
MVKTQITGFPMYFGYERKRTRPSLEKEKVSVPFSDPAAGFPAKVRTGGLFVEASCLL